jgi:hypothetical protein
MPEMNVEDFKFPDEKQESQEQEEQFEVEIEDDTPSEDRRREPMPKPLVEELEQDELDQYDEGVKQSSSRCERSGTTNVVRKKPRYESSKRQLSWLRSTWVRTSVCGKCWIRAVKNTPKL